MVMALSQAESEAANFDSICHVTWIEKLQKVDVYSYVGYDYNRPIKKTNLKITQL